MPRKRCGIGATRRNVSIDADTEAALRWLRERRVCTASRLLREAARVELGRQGMRVWEGEVLTHDEWAARLDATINERVAEFGERTAGRVAEADRTSAKALTTL